MEGRSVNTLAEIYPSGMERVEGAVTWGIATIQDSINRRIVREDRTAGETSLTDPTKPGGGASDLCDSIVSSSDRPSRELELSAVLPFVGALLGRRFASPTDLRTNFYTVALADSGYGKDHARTQLKRLITAAGLDRFSGPNRFLSATRVR